MLGMRSCTQKRGEQREGRRGETRLYILATLLGNEGIRYAEQLLRVCSGDWTDLAQGGRETSVLHDKNLSISLCLFIWTAAYCMSGCGIN